MHDAGGSLVRLLAGLLAATRLTHAPAAIVVNFQVCFLHLAHMPQRELSTGPQGECIFDKFVVPTIAVVDCREATTGIKQWQLFSSKSVDDCLLVLLVLMLPRVRAEDAVPVSCVNGTPDILLTSKN